MRTMWIVIFLICIALLPPAWAGHTLTGQQQKVLRDWLAQHKEYELASDEDCQCADEIKQMRDGYGGQWKPVVDYHPYVATGDFNGDRIEDFAVVLVDRSKKSDNFALLIFNGPFRSKPVAPAFLKSGLDFRYQGLFYGPPRPKPYRLLVGRFESDSGLLLIPHGRGYGWGH